MRYRRIGLFLLATLLALILPVGSALAVPQPTVAFLNLPADPQIGEDITFTVRFDNADPVDIGYGPFIDLFMPVTGADGADGVTFLNATYLGAPVTAIQQTFPAGGCVNHPFLRDAILNPLPVCGVPGDMLVTLELPFGSFTPNQPPADIDITATIHPNGDVGTALALRARGGFRYGANPIDDPCCDAPIVSPTINTPITPELVVITKTNNATVDEIATGPNFPRQFTITVNVPNGQTVTDLDVTDFLPPQTAFVSVDSIIPAGGIVTASPPVNVPAPPGNNELTVRFPSITGTSAPDDAIVVFTFYGERVTSGGGNVINPLTGDDVTIVNSSGAIGDWTPTDPTDAGGVRNATAGGLCAVTPCPGANAPFLMAVAAQKSVTPDMNVAPGDFLTYSIDFQVSDFFSFTALAITDIISDGQQFDAGFTPQLAFAGNPPAPIANFTTAPGANGTTVLTVDLSAELGGVVRGGCIPIGGTTTPDCSVFNGGPTEGTITYRTLVLPDFLVNFPSGDPSVDHGDVLGNELAIVGQIVDNNTFSPAGFDTEDDDALAEATIAQGEPQKTIYAYNGAVCGACLGIQMAPGDTITYRVQHPMPNSDFDNFTLVDFVPIPAFTATEIVPVFDTTISAAVPPAGTAKFGPADTLFNRMTAVLGGAPGVPTIAIDAVENTVTFNYGSFDDPANQPTQLDILFTVTMQSVPVADGLFLANLAQSRERTTQNVVVANDAIAQVGVTAPLLRISKGAVASNNGSVTFSPTITGPVTFNAPGDPIAFSGVINSSTLATAPVNSDIGDINPGDLIRFAIVIENTGTSPYGAFDIRISDNLPPGFQIPPGGSNLTVQYGGAGPAITYTGTDADFFGGGIQLNDPGVNLGVCGPFHATNGLNVIVITYDLLLVTEPNGTVANTASLFNYATAEGGVDATGQQDLTDSAQMFFDFVGGGASGIQIRKSADLPFAQPGEVVTWTVVVTNNDPAPAVNIVVEDTIPPQVQVLDVSVDMGTIAQSGNAYTLTAAILPPGASITMTIQARLLPTLQAPYEIINRALLFVGGQQIGAAQSNILSAATLPLTGESRYGELRQALRKWIHERLYHPFSDA